MRVLSCNNGKKITFFYYIQYVKYPSHHQVRPRTSLYFSLIRQELQEGIARRAERDFRLFESRKGCVACFPYCKLPCGKHLHLSPSITSQTQRLGRIQCHLMLQIRVFVYRWPWHTRIDARTGFSSCRILCKWLIVLLRSSRAHPQVIFHSHAVSRKRFDCDGCA